MELLFQLLIVLVIVLLCSLQREHVKIAQQYFQLVGSSASECDTIPGRQCMASCFFLLRQFEDVLIYLSSIKSYFINDDSFNFNFAQVCLLHKSGVPKLLLCGVVFSVFVMLRLIVYWTSRCHSCFPAYRRSDFTWSHHQLFEISVRNENKKLHFCHFRHRQLKAITRRLKKLFWWFRMRNWKVTTFISATWLDAVRKIFVCCSGAECKFVSSMYAICSVWMQYICLCACRYNE